MELFGPKSAGSFPASTAFDRTPHDQTRPQVNEEAFVETTAPRRQTTLGCSSRGEPTTTPATSVEHPRRHRPSRRAVELGRPRGRCRQGLPSTFRAARPLPLVLALEPSCVLRFGQWILKRARRWGVDTLSDTQSVELQGSAGRRFPDSRPTFRNRPESPKLFGIGVGRL